MGETFWDTGECYAYLHILLPRHAADLDIPYRQPTCTATAGTPILGKWFAANPRSARISFSPRKFGIQMGERGIKGGLILLGVLPRGPRQVTHATGVLRPLWICPLYSLHLGKVTPIEKTVRVLAGLKQQGRDSVYSA